MGGRPQRHTDAGRTHAGINFAAVLVSLVALVLPAAAQARPTDGPSDPNAYTAPDAGPHCTSHFCLHWVASTGDAPSLADANGRADGDGIPDYVETMADTFEFVFNRQVNELGWKRPLPDGGRGGDNRVDIYIKDTSPAHGRFEADPGQQGKARFSFLILDDDYGGSRSPNAALMSTAARGFNRVLQFAYSSRGEAWQNEATASWMEEKVFPGLNGYLADVRSWSGIEQVEGAQSYNLATTPNRMRGVAVWNHWLDRTLGEDVPRAAYERLASDGNRAARSYNHAIRRAGGKSFRHQFVRFAASTAEWRASDSVYPDRKRYPDLGHQFFASPTSAAIEPLGFILLDVSGTSLRPLRLVAYFDQPLSSGSPITNRKTPGGIALVGRTGGEKTGHTTTKLRDLPKGGTGRVTLHNPGKYKRITAVIANADDDSSLGVTVEITTPACDKAERRFFKLYTAYTKARRKLKKAESAATKRKYRRKVKDLKRRRKTASRRETKACA